jgi:hypothetical protein
MLLLLFLLLYLQMLLFVLIVENILPPNKGLLHGTICWSGFERKQGSYYYFQLFLVNQIDVAMEEVHFFTGICERGGSYTEYKKLMRSKIICSVKYECPFRLRGYLLIAGDWSLKVGDGRHNHDMAEVLKSHKIVGRLNPNEHIHLHEMAESNVPLR